MKTENISKVTGYKTVEEMIWLVEQYIQEKKGVKANINLKKGFDMMPNLFRNAVYKQQVEKLNIAFNYAQSYYLNR